MKTAPAQLRKQASVNNAVTNLVRGEPVSSVYSYKLKCQGKWVISIQIV